MIAHSGRRSANLLTDPRFVHRKVLVLARGRVDGDEAAKPGFHVLDHLRRGREVETARRAHDVFVGDPELAVDHVLIFRTLLAAPLPFQALADAGLAPTDRHGVFRPFDAATLALVRPPLPHVAIALTIRIAVAARQRFGMRGFVVGCLHLLLLLLWV